MGGEAGGREAGGGAVECVAVGEAEKVQRSRGEQREVRREKLEREVRSSEEAWFASMEIEYHVMK